MRFEKNTVQQYRPAPAGRRLPAGTLDFFGAKKNPVIRAKKSFVSAHLWNIWIF